MQPWERRQPRRQRQRLHRRQGLRLRRWQLQQVTVQAWIIMITRLEMAQQATVCTLKHTRLRSKIWLETHPAASMDADTPAPFQLLTLLANAAGDCRESGEFAAVRLASK
jgi:hypothetical protein